MCLKFIPPSDVMLSNKRNLSVDEHYFHNVLSAAFTIQEYNDRKLAGTPKAHANRDSEAAVIGEKDEDGVLLFIPGLDAPQEPIATIAAGQLLQEDDLIAPHGAVVADGAALRDDKLRHPQEGVRRFDAVPNQLLRDTVQQALQATRATGAAIALDLQGKLTCLATAGDSASEIRTLIDTGSGFTGLCASSGTMQVCSNTVLDSRVDADACSKIGVRAIIVVPLLRQDQLLGLMAVFSRQPHAFGMRDLQHLQDLAEKFTANLQVSVESAHANTGRESPGACNLSP